jgi:hypothetical protein
MFRRGRSAVFPTLLVLGGQVRLLIASEKVSDLLKFTTIQLNLERSRLYRHPLIADWKKTRLKANLPNYLFQSFLEDNQISQSQFH